MINFKIRVNCAIVYSYFFCKTYQNTNQQLSISTSVLILLHVAHCAVSGKYWRLYFSLNILNTLINFIKKSNVYGCFYILQKVPLGGHALLAQVVGNTGFVLLDGYC